MKTNLTTTILPRSNLSHKSPINWGIPALGPSRGSCEW